MTEQNMGSVFITVKNMGFLFAIDPTCLHSRIYPDFFAFFTTTEEIVTSSNPDDYPPLLDVFEDVITPPLRCQNSEYPCVHLKFECDGLEFCHQFELDPSLTYNSDKIAAILGLDFIYPNLKGYGV